MTSAKLKLLTLSLAITSGLGLSLNFAYSIVSKKISPTETLNASASLQADTNQSPHNARRSSAS